MTYVQLTWKDAVSVDEWTDVDEIKSTYHTIETIGMLICENEDVITVGLNHDIDSGNFCCFIHIPKSMILHRTNIKRIVGE